MIKHLILWKLKSSMSEEEKSEAKAEVKKRLKALNGNIPGLLYLEVLTSDIPSCTADLMLDSSFEDVDSLNYYKDHPMHVQAAEYVRSVVEARLAFDF